MNLVLILGSSAVMTYEINTPKWCLCVSVCVWVSVTFVWRIAQVAVAVISIGSMVLKVSDFHCLKSSVLGIYLFLFIFSFTYEPLSLGFSCSWTHMLMVTKGSLPFI